LGVSEYGRKMGEIKTIKVGSEKRKEGLGWGGLATQKATLYPSLTASSVLLFIFLL